MKINDGKPIFEDDGSAELALYNLFTQNNTKRPGVIIETGTYFGTGTTKAVINALLRAKETIPIRYEPRFYTIEVNENNYKVAVENLSEYSLWLKIIHGSSIKLEDALSFIRHDMAIMNHEDFPDIFIDTYEDPISFYASEVEGQLPYYGLGGTGGDGVIYNLIEKYRGRRPLFILDSAGGIGYLEFKEIVENIADENRYYLFANGKNHLKHFRTYQFIQNNEPWELLDEGENWFLSVHKGSIKVGKKRR